MGDRLQVKDAGMAKAVGRLAMTITELHGKRNRLESMSPTTVAVQQRAETAYERAVVAEVQLLESTRAACAAHQDLRSRLES